ncbi:MAG: hypothetical protein H6774_00910 [Pseudomonadales bacterium]|nr:hypothetical protein [Candidatus Woesebacteria bacterium]MCB9801626.1 hypothetical protein [Pseudomonadales bacterium]
MATQQAYTTSIAKTIKEIHALTTHLQATRLLSQHDVSELRKSIFHLDGLITTLSNQTTKNRVIEQLVIDDLMAAREHLQHVLLDAEQTKQTDQADTTKSAHMFSALIKNIEDLQK